MPHTPSDHSNVINLFTGKSVDEDTQKQVTHICPEPNGIRMLYSNPRKPDRLIAIPVLCWGLRLDGEVVGLVPWLNEVADCTRIDEHVGVTWEGYYWEGDNTIFFEAPELVIAQLSAAARFAPCDGNTALAYSDEYPTCDGEDYVDILQEIPDQVGTHALIVNDDDETLTLTPVLSWALDSNGQLHGMLVDEKQAQQSPVIPGDECLYSADLEHNFRCYFQRDIAHQIQAENPETLAAIEQMLSL